MSRLLFDAFEPAAAVPVTPPPPTPVVVATRTPFDVFAAIIARADRAAQRMLGGQSLNYRTALGVDSTITGIYDAQYVLAKGTAEAGVEALGPAVFVRLEDLPDDPEEDEPTLTIQGVDFRVIERRPDGMGGIVLVLRVIS